jgi:dihydrofolate synthase/folylpolyglutamate synthase
MECGIGGTFSGTNFLTPVCTAITSIGMDHVKLLGGSLEEISKHKAGIIKRGIPCVIGPTCETKSILERA